jgi:kinesin family member 5
LADAYGSRSETETERLAELSEDLQQRTEVNKKLKADIEELQHRVQTGLSHGLGNGDTAGKTVPQQIAEFDQMKKSLMRDLQNRCERVSLCSVDLIVRFNILLGCRT